MLISHYLYFLGSMDEFINDDPDYTPSTDSSEPEEEFNSDDYEDDTPDEPMQGMSTSDQDERELNGMLMY